MNAFEPVFWMGTVYFVILTINRNEPQFWLGAGVIAGLGIINKYPMLLFILGIFIGLLLTKERRFLYDKWFRIAALITFIIFLSNMIWQYQHNWPMIEVMQNVVTTGKNVVLSLLAFIISQFMILNPFTVVSVSDLPIAASAAEWVTEKAAAIGTGAMTLGITVHLGVTPPIIGSPEIVSLLTKKSEQLFGGKFIVEIDPKKAAQLILDHITEARKRLFLQIN
ncbi:MAG: hypothetical protein HGA25_07820 [Clostridiales bacterium]|nr:hypothetical protein [Clostridiales bacterium]